MSKMMLVLVAQVRQKIDGNNEAVKKVISDNRRLTIRKVADNIAITSTNVLGIKCEATNIFKKLLKFWEKKTPHGTGSGTGY